ncbi:MAG: chemotaxis protein CheW [Hyphomicrobiaceae bacterium]|nr:chemotaxis protein CheW [Hyphomicrobiaceae bacterium]
MDDLLQEFLTETVESLDVVDVELVKFEQDPNNAEILANIFRLVHTIKGTCGFLGLPRLGALAHAAETLMGKYRDGSPVTGDGVSLILQTIDRLKEILEVLEEAQSEPVGSDDDLINLLDAMSLGEQAAASVPEAVPAMETPADSNAVMGEMAGDDGPLNIVVRDLKPGEVTLEDLERAFNEAPGPDDMGPPPLPDMDFSTDNEAVPQEAVAQAEMAEPVPVPSKETPAVAPEAERRAKDDRRQEERRAEPKKAPVNQTIRVSVETLEQLMTMVSELVLTRNQLLEMVRKHDDSEFKGPLQRLSNVTAELQEGVMKTRMQPIGNAWQKLPRIVRDLSLSLDKKIDLEMIGAETELDRQVLEVIKDPLTHMVRNSADHGLEANSDRAMLGKPEIGKITLSAYHEGGQIIIKIVDDGRGLDAEKIRAKVLSSELATEDELDRMSEGQIQKFIFHPGFSTAKEVTAVSGRGVGMDVVRTNIELIGGTVDLISVVGKGTTFIIKIPLTLAIVSALIVEVSGQRFAVPQLSVVELVRAHGEAGHRIEMINDAPVLRLRNELLPLIYLNKQLGLEPSPEYKDAKGGKEFVIITQVGSQTFGIVVDFVFHTEEIVVKPMSNMLRDISMFSGNTILGDGSVIMIIDPNGIAQSVAADSGVQAAVERQAAVVQASVREDLTTLLVFSAGSDEPKAVPLSLVTRLEEIDNSKIERINGRDLVQYRGKLMPLVYLDDYDPASRGDKPRQPVLVFTDDDHSMGLVVDKIIDIVEDRLVIEIQSDIPGVLGSAVIREKATELIDVAHYLPKAFDDWLDRKDRPNGGNMQKNLNLLLVDDSSFFRNMLAPLLGSAGYHVTLAASGEEALSLKERGINFDLIVSDIEMPGMNGIEFAEKLKFDPDWGDTPIIALSSHAEPDIIEKSKEAGFHEYVGKFDREGLVETLREVRVGMEEAS